MTKVWETIFFVSLLSVYELENSNPRIDDHDVEDSCVDLLDHYYTTAAAIVLQRREKIQTHGTETQKHTTDLIRIQVKFVCEM